MAELPPEALTAVHPRPIPPTTRRGGSKEQVEGDYSELLASSVFCLVLQVGWLAGLNHAAAEALSLCRELCSVGRGDGRQARACTP